MRAFFKIVIGWIVFPLGFTLWYIDCKISGLSNGLMEDYMFWHKNEYKDMKKYSQYTRRSSHE